MAWLKIVRSTLLYLTVTAFLAGLAWMFYGGDKEERQPAMEVQKTVDVEEKTETAVIEKIRSEDKRSIRENAAVSRRAEGTFVLPATGEISSPFGRRWGRMHQGIDIADEEGTPIVAALGGKVTYAGWLRGYGYTVILEHGRGYSTLYGHMREISTRCDQNVRQGECIGRMGSTGNSTGPHVHFEVILDGTPLDPVHVLR